MATPPHSPDEKPIIPNFSSTHSSTNSDHPLLSKLNPAVRQLDQNERLTVCRAIGAFSEDEEKLSPTINVKKLPDGLYKDIIQSRQNSQRMYYILATLYNFCLVLQLGLGAILTALGATSKETKLAITTLAAANTINAGIIALMHNSGLPNRYRKDWSEFYRVELFVQELVHTGIIQKDLTVADTIDTCWTM